MKIFVDNNSNYYEAGFIPKFREVWTTRPSALTERSVRSDALYYRWTVKDMFSFENVGFTNSVDGIRYLTCADCDFGPIGRVTEDNLHIVAPSRVKMGLDSS